VEIGRIAIMGRAGMFYCGKEDCINNIIWGNGDWFNDIIWGNEDYFNNIIFLASE
jgi:hypothetical protein